MRFLFVLLCHHLGSRRLSIAAFPTQGSRWKRPPMFRSVSHGRLSIGSRRFSAGCVRRRLLRAEHSRAGCCRRSNATRRDGLDHIFWTNLFTAASYLAAVPIARRFGLISTMVFTHLPSNLCLVLIPFMPHLGVVIGLLLLRSLLSQMDVPTRTSYVMAVVTPPERPAAASLTAVPRSLASAVSPIIAGYLLQPVQFRMAAADRRGAEDRLRSHAAGDVPSHSSAGGKKQFQHIAAMMPGCAIFRYVCFFL